MNLFPMILVSIGVMFVILNWTCLLTSLFTRKFSSMVPPLGGLFVTIGLLFDAGGRRYAWLGLPADCGFWALLAAAPLLIRDARRRSRRNLVMKLIGSFDSVSLTLSLYRNDYFCIELAHALPPNTVGWNARSSFGSWSQESGRMVLRSHTDAPEHPSRMVMTFNPNLNCYETIESSFEPTNGYRAPELPPVGTKLRTDS